MKAGEQREIVLRILSAAALAILALGATVYGPWTFLVLVMVGGGLVSWEWGRLTRGNGFDGTALLSAVSVAALAICIAFGGPRYGFFLLAAAGATIWLSGQGHFSREWALSGLIYAALPAAALMWLRSDAAFGAAAVVYLFAVAWTTDTASYAAGRLIGGAKLAPHISPRKTWSGLLAGILAPALVGYVAAEILESGSPLRLALLSVVLAFACQFGDLLESWVKRCFGAKDSSQLIPGHGGLLDRIDGLMMAAVLAGLIALRDPDAPARALLFW
ncbi:MAG: phosphatidate cytidylyltransferase [Methyloceanibacter sp.]